MKYNHDMMHCSQDECIMKDTCYRYLLGQSFKNSGWQYASFYYPKEPIIEGCEHYIEVEEQQ